MKRLITKTFLVSCLLLIFPVLTFCQTVSVRGVLRDDLRNPLSGVSVRLKGSQSGTSSDSSGNYLINIPVSQATGGTLVFSYVGTTPKEIPIGNRLKIDLTIDIHAESMNQVIVVGYGSQKRNDVTGAISQTTGDQIAKAATPDLSNSLVGRVSGIISVQRNAEPGSDAADIFIRGSATLNDNSPLVMVDGIQRDFNRLDPNEVESISILKDASATAIYGVRGANGVILVTTKKGKSGKPSFDYIGYAGWQSPTKMPLPLNGYDYARLLNRAQLNDNPSLTEDELPYSQEALQKYKDGSDPFNYPSNNWYDLLIKKNTAVNRQTLSISGGSDRIRYYLMFGDLSQQGLFKNAHYNTYNFRANLDIALTKSTDFNVNVGSQIENKNFPAIPEGNIFGILNYLAPNAFPVYNEDGSYSALWAGGNPVANVQEYGYNKSRYYPLQSSFTLTQRLDFLTKGLALKIVVANDFGYSTSKNWITPYPAYYRDGTSLELLDGGKPALYQGSTNFVNKTFETHLSYNRTFNRHTLGGLILYTQSSYNSETLSASRDNYASSALDQLFAGPRTNINNDGGASESGREGVVGRFNYAYDQKYLFEVSFAYNGSENFPPGKRFGFFPAASVGWNLSKEAFMENNRVITDLRVRASYGEVGNDRVGYRRFLYRQPVYYGNNYVFGSQPVQTLYNGELANPNVTWERAKKSNVGFDIGILNGLLGIRGDFFRENRNNILANRTLSVPATFGAALPVENIASVLNRGVELELNHARTFGAFSYTINLNYTFARNKIAFIDEPSNIAATRRRTGKPMDQWFGFIADGYYQSQDEIDKSPKFQDVDPRPGEIKYKDINGDGKLDDNDITAIGKSPTPESIFGLNLGARYNGLDFNCLFQAATGYNILPAGEGIFEFMDGGSATKIILDNWTPDHPNASYPRLSVDRFSYKRDPSTFWLKDASYVRLRSAELGYTFPKPLFPANSIKKLRVYVSGTNLLTFSKFKWYDPEAPSGNSIWYPVMKTINIGANLSF